MPTLVDKCEGLPPSTLVFILFGEQERPHGWQTPRPRDEARKLIEDAIAKGQTKFDTYTLIPAEDPDTVQARHEKRLAALEKARAARADKLRAQQERDEELTPRWTGETSVSEDQTTTGGNEP